MSLFEVLLAVLISFLAGIFFGWLIAHSTVSEECRRIGGFYVGNTTYICSIDKREKP